MPDPKKRARGRPKRSFDSGPMRDYAQRLALMADEAMRLGLLRTYHAFSYPTEEIANKVRGPLGIVGFELADIIDGRQAVPAPRRKR